jgi:hypothetical protein
MRFNPNHDELGRFTFADGGGGGRGSDTATGEPGNDRVRVAQAGPPRATRQVTVSAGTFNATEAEATELLQVARRAENALTRVRQVDEDFRPAASISGNETARGAIDSYRALAQQAEARATVLERGGVPLGFSSRQEFQAFGASARNSLMFSGQADAEIFLRGSSVTGFGYETGELFDSGRRSDYDFAIVSPRLFQRAAEAGIALRGGNTRTGVLRESALKDLGLNNVLVQFRQHTGRDVSIVLYRSREDLAKRGPHLPVQ